MPFKNQAQARAIFAKDKSLGKEFAAKTPNMAGLPQGPKPGYPGPGAGGPLPLASLMGKKPGLMGR